MKSVLKDFPLSVTGFTFPELNILYSGCQKCAPGYKYGPAVRKYYIIHYVLSGKGVLHFDGKEFPVHSGQAFLIEPDYVTCYEADKNDPWEYVWINFNGDYAKKLLETAGFSQFSPVFPQEFNSKLNDIFLNLRLLLQDGSADEMYVLGSLMQVISCITDLSSYIQKMYPKRTIYIKRALDYIDNNFHLPLTVEEVAKLLQLDRKYFCAIFKEETGVSPITYILSLKVARSAELLRNTNLSIGEIARSVGYEDLFTFSRMFRQQVGISPTKFKTSDLNLPKTLKQKKKPPKI